jgi:hypothetical protein
MSDEQTTQLLVLSAQADHLADLFERKGISKEEYFTRLNGIRQRAGLDPLRLPTPPTAEVPQERRDGAGLVYRQIIQRAVNRCTQWNRTIESGLLAPPGVT